jgi:hypothetical protein
MTVADQTTNPTPVAPTTLRTQYVEDIGGVMSDNLVGRGEQLGILYPRGGAKFSGEVPTAAARSQVLHDQRESNGARYGISAFIQAAHPATRGDLDTNTRTMSPSGGVHRDFWHGPTIGY